MNWSLPEWIKLGHALMTAGPIHHPDRLEIVLVCIYTVLALEGELDGR